MSWKLSISLAVALLALCRGHNTMFEGYDLSISGYHLCTGNETRQLSFLVARKVLDTVARPCGGWLPWKTCEVSLYRMTYQTEYNTVTEEVTRCCDGFVQLGSYCALPLNRSRELTAKPGSCSSTDVLPPGPEDCEWDIDCPGWQKCCRKSGVSLCTNPANSSHYSENGGWRFNVTVTVKTDYQQLMSKDRGLLNHTRLLHAMVTGALDSDVSVHYLSSWPVDPFRTATSLLIGSNFTLSLFNTTAKLHLLLKHIEEVSSVTVEDVNECAHTGLRKCSPQAECNNTVGSYICACRQGYMDVDPSNTGANCEADSRGAASTEHPETCDGVMVPASTSPPPMSTTHAPTYNTTPDLRGNTTAGSFNSSETIVPTAAPHTSVGSTVELPSDVPTCSPPLLTTLQSANVTGASFCVHWSSQFQRNLTYLVVLSRGSEVLHHRETNQTMWEVMGLDPGMLYSVNVTPCACGRQGDALRISVKTVAQTLEATARLTNIPFTADLLNSSSQAYQNLTKSIEEEIKQSLPPEIKAMVASGEVRIEITSLSQGSVVVNFTIIFTPSQSQDIRNVTSALTSSLMNSSKYTLDENGTSINDFNECATGEHDCSQWATCSNTWASYRCVCLDGFTDINPARPGRACQAMVTTTPFQTATRSLSTTVPPPVISQPMAPVSTMMPTPSTIAAPVATTVPTTTTTTLTITTAAPTTTTAAPTTTTTAPTTTTTAPVATTIPTTTTTAPTTTTTALTTTTTAPTTTTTAPTTTTIAPTTTPTTATTAPTTTTTAPTTAPTTTTTAPTTTTTAPTTTTTAPTTNTTAPTTTPTTATTAPTTTTTAPTTAPTTTTTAPTTAPTTTTTASSTTTALTSTTIAPPTTTTAPTTTVSNAISVQCRAAVVTATVARDFLVTNQISDSVLYLGLEDCGINGGNDTHAQLIVGWNECDTRLLHNQTYYTAEVTLFNSMEPQALANGTVWVPKIRLQVPIMCTYRKSMLISASYGPTGYEMIKDAITGWGSFHVTVRLMNGTALLPQNYSLSRDEDVVVEVSLNTSAEQIKVVINKCWATPNNNPTHTTSYTFVENSCSLPNTYTTMLVNGNSSTSRLSVRIFSFVNLDVIYLHCQVQICVQMGSATCVPDCTERTGRLSNTIGLVYGSSGPICRYGADAFEEGMTTVQLVGFCCLGIGLALVFLGAFICLFYYQRNRIGHYNFSLKPKQENFTYLVFNT